MKTIQLRRYEIVESLFDEFVEWFTARLLPVRRDAGFVIEFAYANRAQSEFVWAVSIEGDEARFTEVSDAYSASPERAAAFEGVPQYATAQHIEFVEAVH